VNVYNISILAREKNDETKTMSFFTYLIKMLIIGLENSKLSGEFDRIIRKFNVLTSD